MRRLYAGVPYWRLSGFYLFFFGTLGATLPYWSLYLKHLGFAPAQIGELVAILLATKVIAPNVWGWVADHLGRRILVIRVASLLAVAAFAGVFFGHGYWWLAAVMAGFSFFWNAALPQFEATTMNYLGDRPQAYSGIRLWGSVGFVLTVVALGGLIDHHGTDLLPAAILGLLGGLWLVSMTVPESPTDQTPREHQPLGRVVRDPRVLGFLLVCFLMQASHGPYYTFFTIHLEEAGYSGGIIGPLWALGVVAEIGVFLLMHRWLPRFGPQNLLLVSLALATARWLAVGWLVDSLPALILAQTLHAATFGIFHAVAIHLVHRFFVGKLQGRGQALYSSLSFGAGGAVGSLYAGYLWSGAGAAITFSVGALLSGVAFIIVWRSLRVR